MTDEPTKQQPVVPMWAIKAAMQRLAIAVGGPDAVLERFTTGRLEGEPQASVAYWVRGVDATNVADLATVTSIALEIAGDAN